MTNIIHYNFKRPPVLVSEIEIKIETQVIDDGSVWYRTECCGRVGDWIKIEEKKND